MLPTARDSRCTKCPAARLAPQRCVFQLFPVNFNTCAKKTLIELSVLAFVIRRKVIISGLDTCSSSTSRNIHWNTHTHPVETSGSLKLKSLPYLSRPSQVFSVYLNFYLSNKARESHLLVLPKYIRRMP